MNYLALGDSISIDDYTGVPKGGAVNQLARLIGAEWVQDLTRDSGTTDDVLAALDRMTIQPNIVTLTVGGNDFLLGAYLLSGPNETSASAALARGILDNLRRIAERLAAFGCPVLLNTIYDPTDGDDSFSGALGIPPSFRRAYDAINNGIRQIARERGFLLSDLEKLFHGHGLLSPDPWFVMQIEPNYAGATAIARHWHALYRQEG